MLHVRAKERMQSGELPTYAPSSSYAGRGSTITCALCDAPILPTDVELELEFVAQGADRKVIRLHSRCESVWNEERLRLHNRP
ncbi:MAG: hypothetical protein JWO04_4380 [Gammaproteobacteria bacterium]|jgi:hypothetical protein|nr:hypothetical protein [Gammaproteobacteria bacterium]